MSVRMSVEEAAERGTDMQAWENKRAGQQERVGAHAYNISHPRLWVFLYM